MNVSRGDVVLIEFPFASGIGSKFRPAVVVQSDRFNRRSINTVVVGVSSKVARAAHEKTLVLVDPDTKDGLGSGLAQLSVVKCDSLYTIEMGKIRRVLGTLSETVMKQVNAALKLELDLE